MSEIPSQSEWRKWSKAIQLIVWATLGGLVCITLGVYALWPEKPATVQTGNWDTPSNATTSSADNVNALWARGPAAARNGGANAQPNEVAGGAASNGDDVYALWPQKPAAAQSGDASTSPSEPGPKEHVKAAPPPETQVPIENTEPLKIFIVNRDADYDPPIEFLKPFIHGDPGPLTLRTTGPWDGQVTVEKRITPKKALEQLEVKRDAKIYWIKLEFFIEGMPFKAPVLPWHR